MEGLRHASMTDHKNQKFFLRLRFALTGLMHAVRAENSFRFQAGAFILVVLALLVLQPEPLWWALVLLASASVLAAELFNTAIEHLADHQHPGREGLRGRRRVGGRAGSGGRRGGPDTPFAEPLSSRDPAPARRIGQIMTNCRL
jgi:diacylglycerol kinase